MAIEIVSRQFENEFNSGSTQYLLGCLLEKIVYTSIVNIYWESHNVSGSNPLEINTSSNTVTRTYGSWIKDEFRIGDAIVLSNTVEGAVATAIITGLTDTVLTYGTVVGTEPTVNTDLYVYGTTELKGFIYKYGLNENSASSPSFLSLIDNNDQAFLANNLTVGGGAVTANKQGTFSSWLAGSCTIEKTVAPTSGNNYRQTFKIIHTFYIFPAYLSGQSQNIEDLVPPDYFISTKCLKYVASYTGKPSIYNPNSSHPGTDSLLLGDTGWYNENFNGINRVDGSSFSVYSIDYSTDDSIDLNGCSVEIQISSTNNVFSSGNTKFVLHHIFMNDDETDYSNNTNTLFQNFIYDRAKQTIGSAGVAGDNGIFSNVVGSIVSNRLKITATLSFTTDQKTKLENGKYILAVTTCDHTKTIEDSDRMTILCDSQVYVKNNDDSSLLTWDSVKWYEKPFNSEDNPLMGMSDFKGWIVDDVYGKIEFTTKSGKLNSLSLIYQVQNAVTDDVQNLDVLKLDFTGNPVQPTTNIRFVNVDGGRGYILPNGDLRDIVKIEMGTPTGNDQPYTFEIASRLRWEDWLKLQDIDSQFNDFFDFSLPQNGLNQKWDRYDAGDWVVKAIIQAVVADEDDNVTIFNRESSVEIHDYNEDGNTTPLWVGEIETFDGATSLGVDDAARLSAENDTKIVATFDCSPFSLDTTSLYGIISMEEYQNGGVFGIHQINTLDLPKSGIMLKPITGETKCKLTIVDAQTVTLEALCDVNFIQPGLQYHIVARLGSTCGGSLQPVWTNKHLVILGSDLYFKEFAWTSTSVGYAISGNDIIYKTTDSGETWSAVGDLGGLFISSWLAFGMKMINASTGFSFFNNKFFKTIDGCVTNTLVSTTAEPITRDIAVISTSIVFTCGIGGAGMGIHKSTNGGVTWASKYSANAVNCLKFFDANNGLAGGYDKIFKTTDAGENWSLITVTGIQDTMKIFYYSSTVVWAAGLGGLYKSTDSGSTWSLVLAGYFTSVYFFDSNKGMLTQYGSTSILKTIDGGLNWNVELTNGVDSWYDVYMPNADGGVICGGGHISVSADEGIIALRSLQAEYCNIIDNISGRILKEDGSYLLTETGDKIPIE